MRFESVAKEFLNLSADVIPVPIPNTIKEKAMSFSINLIGEAVSAAEGEAKRIEDLILADVKRLVASHDSITAGTFKGSTVTVDLTPVRPAIPPTAAPTSTVSTPADAPTPATVAAPPVAPVAPVAPVVVDSPPAVTVTPPEVVTPGTPLLQGTITPPVVLPGDVVNPPPVVPVQAPPAPPVDDEVAEAPPAVNPFLRPPTSPA
jgi:hypothetical protein